jgi:hypothetical protein
MLWLRLLQMEYLPKDKNLDSAKILTFLNEINPARSTLVLKLT